MLVSMSTDLDFSFVCAKLADTIFATKKSVQFVHFFFNLTRAHYSEFCIAYPRFLHLI